MYRKVNQRKFSKATLARLSSVMLLLVVATPHLTVVAEEVTYSELWGRSGELWSPTSRLPDFSYAGYNRGEHPLRELKADVSVKQFGAIGDGETDDTHAFKKAIEQSPGKTILVPAGRYRITDFLYIRHTGTSLLGESPVKSILFFPTPLHTIKPDMGATTSGQPTSNYSWSGGFVFVTGSSSRDVLAEVTSQARRGQRSLSVSTPEAFTVGQDVRLSLRDTERQSLAKYLYADDLGPITNLKSRAQVSFLCRITKIDIADKYIEFDRPLRSDVRLQWRPRLYDASCSVEDVGIQNLCFEFPVTPYKGHFTELGYNAIAMSGVRNCWVRNIRIHNADSGMFISGNNITLREISLTSERPRERQRKATGHHGITIGGQDNLFDKFQFETRFMHDITVTSGSAGNVAASGRGVDICFDHHCYAPHSNLFTDIDLGKGSRMFQSGGGAALGRHSASWETFWCIRAQRTQKWPDGWGPDLMNFIAVQPGQESVTDADGRWFEAIEPARLHPRNLYESQIRRRLQSRVSSQRASAEPLTSIRIEPKPVDHAMERRVQRQPTVPPDYKEMPFIETAAEPELTSAEKQSGYLLFHRPITEPVYPNSRPLAHERLEQLVAFATPGEFEPLTFSIYPVRKLQNLKVRCSSLTCDAGEIPAAEITLRLGTYWNVGYPRYTSRSTYRRTPELLERLSVHSSPPEECQRYWIQVHVPSDAKPGLYKATVSVWDDGFEKAIQIPVLFRVLAFKLHKDPAKHYSAYYYVRNRTQYADKPKSFVRKAAANEYRAMVAYGLDMIPTLYLGCADGQTIYLPYPDELNQMLKAGLTGPIPVTAGNVISRFYRDTTPGGERGSHWHISKLPPPEFYERITAAFKAFEIERKAKGWPEFICCPIDEVAAERKEFGAKVYAAVKAAGIRTYATKDPTAADAAPYRPYIDIWCSQPYSVPYEKIVGQDQYEYWCYPNHNAGEIKDRRVMCKGGRMTYGFGFWRSGYTTLIPWNWNWTPGKDQFDYLRGSHSGCGQRIDEDGEVIPAIYWECFREGKDDARYIYTLQQAIFQCEGSPNAECRRAVAVARKLLQDTWDAINVQEKYLADGMWPSEEFNTRRWLLAQAISELLQHPAVRTDSAPSVLVTNTSQQPANTETSIIDKALQAGNIQSIDLGGDFTAWSNGTKEGMAKITAASGRKDIKELHWRVRIDHKMDGGEGGKYPVGWPRIARSFRESQLDFSAYDYLSLLIRVDSNRDEVADDSTRLGLSLRSHAPPKRLFETRVDLGDRQRQWIPLRFSLSELIGQAGVGLDPWRSISNVQLFVAESDYAHGTNLTFQVRDIKLLRFTTPTIQRVYAPEYITLPRNRLAVSFSILGTRTVRKGSHTITVSLASGDGRTQTEQQQDLADGRVAILDTSTLVPGRYRMDLIIVATDGTRCAQERQSIEAVDGLLASP